MLPSVMCLLTWRILNRKKADEGYDHTRNLHDDILPRAVQDPKAPIRINLADRHSPKNKMGEPAYPVNDK